MMTANELYAVYLVAQRAADDAADICAFVSYAEADAWAHGDLDAAPTFAKARELAIEAKAAYAEYDRAWSDEYDDALAAAQG